MVLQILCYPCGALLLNRPPPLKRLKTKLSETSYSLTVHEFSTGICLLIYLFIIYLLIYSFRLFFID